MNQAPHHILAEFFKHEGLNQLQVAHAMGYNQAYISRVLRGERAVSDAFLWRFQEAFTDPTSPFFLPGAASLLLTIRQHNSHAIRASA